MIDYSAIKAAVSVEKAARFLGLQLKPHGETHRGDCPQCDKPRVLIVTPSKNVWYCHALKKGGDAIYLVAHIRGVKQSEAAQVLQQEFMREPQKPRRTTNRNTNRGKNSKSRKPTPSTFQPRPAEPQQDEYADWFQL
jgi:DNA primase